MERMGDGNWVKRVRSVNVEGVSAKGRPEKTWNELVLKDLRDMSLKMEEAKVPPAWRAASRSFN